MDVSKPASGRSTIINCRCKCKDREYAIRNTRKRLPIPHIGKTYNTRFECECECGDIHSFLLRKEYTKKRNTNPSNNITYFNLKRKIKGRDEVTMKSLYETRIYVYTKLGELLGTCWAKDVEASIMKYTKERAEKARITRLVWSNKHIRRWYLQKYRSIVHNIDSVREQLECKAIRGQEVAQTHPWAWSPTLWEPIQKRQEKRTHITRLWEEGELCDGILQCVNEECKSMKTRYVELQTRGSDEPTTVYACCVVCGTHWTIDGK